MIQLLDRGKDQSMIQFSPRSIYRNRPTVECELQFGYKCPYCNNVIQAFFFTNEPIDLEIYEETRVLSQGEKNVGELLKVIPGPEFPGNYKSDFFRTPNGNAQRITLKNHVVNMKGSGITKLQREDLFETGERCCMYSGIISLREENVVFDYGIVSGYFSYYPAAVAKLYEEGHPSLEFFRNWLSDASSYETVQAKMINAVGNAPPAVLVQRKTLKDLFAYSMYYLVTKWTQEQEKLKEAQQAQAA